MPRYELHGPSPAPVHLKETTALMLVHCQYGYRDTSIFSNPSTPNFEENVAALLGSFREVLAAKPKDQQPLVLHVQYRPVWNDHHLHVSKKGPFGKDGEQVRAIDFLEFARQRTIRSDGTVEETKTFDEPSTPEEVEKFKAAQRERQNAQATESIMTSHGHSPFINSSIIEHMLNKRGIKTLIIAGLTTDHAVSTAVRTAQNEALVGHWGGQGNMEDEDTERLYTDGVSQLAVSPDEHGKDRQTVDMPRIIVASDATRAFGKGSIDSETAQKVHLESFKDFAEVWTTEQLVEAFRQASE